MKYQFSFQSKNAAAASFSPTGAPAMLSVRMMPIEPRLTPRDEVVFLLHTATEIEHALLVQYLYAAYSVKPEHAAWRFRILAIAVQEMGHLISMQNVLHFLRGPLTLDREDFPFRGAFYPFHFKLEPLSLDSLAKYVVAEMPEQPLTPELKEIIKQATGANAGMELNRVGALFERVDKLFDELTPDDTNPASAETVQATPAEWGATPGGQVIVETVRTLEEARTLLNRIAVQGEGGDMSPDNHFMTFLEIYREAKASGGPLSLPVPTNPNTAPTASNDADMEAGRITNEEARRWAQIGDLRYRMLLAFLLHALHLDYKSSSTARKLLSRATFAAMRGTGTGGVRGINAHLITLPQHDDGQTARAAIPFALPYSLEIPVLEADRWRLHLDLLEASRLALADVTTGIEFRDSILRADESLRSEIESMIVSESGPAVPPPSAPPVMPPAPADGTNSAAAFQRLMRDKQPTAQFAHSGILLDASSLSDAFAAEDYDAILNYLTTANALRSPFAGMPLVTPGNPAKSALYLHATQTGGAMAGVFSPVEQQVIERWIRDLPASGQGAVGALVAATTLTATQVASGLSQPVFVTAAPGDDSQVFIVEKTGDIRILNLTSGQIAPRPFLTVDDLSTNSERGLLGLTFHPDYATNGRFYVNCTDANGRTTVRRYLVSSNPDAADPASRQNVLVIDQPFPNHNAGWIDFGPNDDLLYIATGDGGSGNDPFNNAQDGNSLLGKMLRIDVNGDDFPGDPTRNYAIPPDNPFMSVPATRNEIWALGLRNPWRCSFDRETADLYIGDVGQFEREEINFQQAISRGGENYGWRIREGSMPTGLDPDVAIGLTNPIFEYGRADGRAIVGGYVYRGTRIAGLTGTYFYADFVSQRIWSFSFNGSSISQHVERTAEIWASRSAAASISSFGQDASGELYLTSLSGEVFRIE